jgi:AcrR family transcriptional regulator
MIKKADAPRPAHRPSRREEIIDAAIRVFSREGYTAASVEDIAQECGVAPTAVYYHFGGKDELFNQALRTALDRFSEAVYLARMTGDPTAPATLRRVIHAGWLRAVSHPEEMRFLLQHTFRPTPEARKLQQDWEERHVERSLDYLPQPESPPRTPREARVRHAARLLSSRVMVYTTIVAQESRLAGGPLGELPVPEVAEAVEDVCIRIVTGTADSESALEAAGDPVPVPAAGESPARRTAAKKVPAKRAPAKKAATPKAAPAKAAPAKKASADTAVAGKGAAKAAAAKQAAKASAAKPAAKKATPRRRPSA